MAAWGGRGAARGAFGGNRGRLERRAGARSSRRVLSERNRLTQPSRMVRCTCCRSDVPAAGPRKPESERFYHASDRGPCHSCAPPSVEPAQAGEQGGVRRLLSEPFSSGWQGSRSFLRLPNAEEVQQWRHVHAANRPGSLCDPAQGSIGGVWSSVTTTSQPDPRSPGRRVGVSRKGTNQ